MESKKEWWGKLYDKKFDRIVERLVEDGEKRERGVEGGELDMDKLIKMEDEIRIEDKKGLKMIEGKNMWEWKEIYINNKKDKKENEDLRKEIVKDLDYKEMIDL